MNKLIAIGAGLLLLVLLLLFTTTYTVSFHEVAVRTRFGQAGEDPVVRDPGLHFKLPFFIDQVEKFDTRLQLVESPLETVPVSDGQQILVRSFLLWQVETEGDGPLEFFKSYGGVGTASQDLRDHLSNALGVMGQYAIEDLLGENSKLAEVEERILAAVQSSTGGEGGVAAIRPARIGIAKIVLPPATTRSVIDRMKVTRQTIANNERGKGNAESARILADANTKAEKIRAFAVMFAAEIRGEGEREAAKYIGEMAEDPEFAIFLTWKKAFEDALSSYSTFILPPDFAPMHLIDLQSELRSEGGTPMPSREAMDRITAAMESSAGSSGRVTLGDAPTTPPATDDDGGDD